MASPKFVTQLTQQIGNEFSAHQQYVAIATYYDGLTMPQMAALFYQQALEERDHAMMMVQYLLDADEDVAVPGVDTPKSGF
ncbi:MAG TPA: ferritin-like domain-containing protein, partial [Nocardioidaceae bacterium]|nr:ferritin-like domain-containing protein [Nocardioidaceae bacterium]